MSCPLRIEFPGAQNAAGTIAGDLVTKRIKPRMTNNGNAERIGIATELIVEKAANENR